jgi:hypothetical protein
MGPYYIMIGERDIIEVGGGGSTGREEEELQITREVS